jgi:serine/threonine protein kinase
MTTSTSIVDSCADGREKQLNAVLLQVMRSLEKGIQIDRPGVLAAYPELAAELEEFFAGRECLQRVAGRELVRPRPAGPFDETTAIGDFRLLREVGRGGMGVVYEAHQLSLDRHVALKVLPCAAALDPRQLQRFKNEAHAAALLNHPNIVPIYSVGCEQGTHYYAMQFIEGQSVAGLITELRRSRADTAHAAPGHTFTNRVEPPDGAPATNRPQTSPLSPSEEAGTPAADTTHSPSKTGDTHRPGWKQDYFRRVADLGMKAAEALEHAHQLGVVHRDVKPANLLLDRRGALWITDFGVALLKSKDGLTSTGELVGTLRYMSPEQAGAQRDLVDQRTDIYSLGATLYELLTLEPPFPANDPGRLVQQILGEEPRSPRSLDRAIPVELEVIVLKAMAKVPAERYASAGELADDLRRFLNDQPILARRPAMLDRLLKWSRRHRTAVVSAVVLLLLVTLGLLVSTVLIAHAAARAEEAYQNERTAAARAEEAYQSERARAEEAREQRERAEESLAQARQVVDFLTQVSAEELGDRPELLPVRQKMLEAALGYYRQFVEQYQADSSVRHDLDASRARVERILGALAAQRLYQQFMLRTMLLEDRSVRQHLRLTERQVQKVLDLSEKLTQQRQEALRGGAALSEQQRGKKLEEMAAANEKAVAAILTAKQGQRLKQIAVQQRGARAFADDATADALKITEEQQVCIRDVLRDAAREEPTLRPGLPLQEMARKAARVEKQAFDRILAVLTPKQRLAWRDLSGEPFRGSFSFTVPSYLVSGMREREREREHHSGKSPSRKPEAEREGHRGGLWKVLENARKKAKGRGREHH